MAEAIARHVAGDKFEFLSGGSNPAEFIPQLLERVASLFEGNLSQDDATLILFRANGSAPSLTNSLLAPFRLLSPVRDNTGIS